MPDRENVKFVHPLIRVKLPQRSLYQQVHSVRVG
jgi:hypothetical protein